MRLRRYLILFLAAVCLLTAQKKTDDEESKAAAASGSMLDINTASADQLKALPGINDAYAAKIIAGRPYSGKNELVEKGVIPQEAYDRIKNRIVAKQDSRR